MMYCILTYQFQGTNGKLLSNKVTLDLDYLNIPCINYGFLLFKSLSLKKKPKPNTFNRTFFLCKPLKISCNESCGLFAPERHCLWQTLDPAAKILRPEYARVIKLSLQSYAQIKHRSLQKKKKSFWNAPRWQTIIIDFLLILVSCISGSTGEIILQNRQTKQTHTHNRTHTCTQVGHSVDVALWSEGQGFGSDLARIPAHNYFVGQTA